MKKEELRMVQHVFEEKNLNTNEENWVYVTIKPT